MHACFRKKRVRTASICRNNNTFWWNFLLYSLVEKYVFSMISKPSFDRWWMNFLVGRCDESFGGAGIDEWLDRQNYFHEGLLLCHVRWLQMIPWNPGHTSPCLRSIHIPVRKHSLVGLWFRTTLPKSNSPRRLSFRHTVVPTSNRLGPIARGWQSWHSRGYVCTV